MWWGVLRPIAYRRSVVRCLMRPQQEEIDMSDKIEEMKDQSIIHGTLRPQDLVPAFADALRVLSPERLKNIVTLLPERDDHPWWETEECAEVLNDLFDLLNEYAPEGYYFGAHPGDGSDFGFWEFDETV